MNFVQPIRSLKKLEEIERVLLFGCGRIIGSARNRLLFLVGINAGLRISDLLRLRVSDVQGTHIVIREKKTGKLKRALLNSLLRRELKSYTVGKDGRVFLFRSRQGSNQPLTRSGAYALLKKAAGEVGLEEIGTHTLRKTFGYHMFQANRNVAELMELFNHSHPSTTLRYIGVNQDALDKAMRGFELGGSAQ